VRRGAQLVSIGGLCCRTILTWHHMAKYLQLFFPETTEPFENNFISWNAPWMILYKLLFFVSLQDGCHHRTLINILILVEYRRKNFVTNYIPVLCPNCVLIPR
jgi:hypothetical protein